MFTNNNISDGAHSYHGSCLSAHTSPTSAANRSSDNGINYFTSYTNHAASTATDITIQSTGNKNTNSTKDVGNLHGITNYASIPNQYTAPYGSSTPNTNTQGGKDTYTDAGVHSNQHGSPICNNSFFMPCSIYYPYLCYYPPIYPGYYPPYAEVYISQNTHENIEHGNYKHSVNSPCLYPLNSEKINSEKIFKNKNKNVIFNLWVRNLAVYLINAGLKDLIPNSQGNTLREPTPAEKQYILFTFFHYIPNIYYPKWFNEWLNNPLNQYAAIQHALKQAIQKDEYLAIIPPMHICNCNQNCATHLNMCGTDNNGISSDNQHIPLTSNKINKTINTTNTAKICTKDTAVKNFSNTSLGGTIMDNNIHKSLFESDKPQYTSIDNQKHCDSITSPISPDILNKSNKTKVTTSGRQVMSFNSHTSTTLTPSPTSLYHNSSCTCDQSQNEHCFIDNSTLGGISSMNVDKKHVEDCQVIKGNKNEKVRIGHERNIIVANKIPKYNNNNVTQDFKEYESVNVFANKLFIRFTHFYDNFIKDIRYHMIVHPYRFRKKNIIHIIF